MPLVTGASRSGLDGSREVVALDIGGTKVAAGVVDDSGRLRERRVLPTGRDDGAERVLERALALVDEVVTTEREAGRRPRALGVSTMGLTHEDGVKLAPAVGGWSELRIPVALRESFPDLPTTVVNDVKAATMAELAWGALCGVSDGLYVNLGTGFAAGVVFGGHLIQGAHGAAGEIGYIVPSLDSLAQHAPGAAVLEERIGGRGIEARTQAELGRAIAAAELSELSAHDARARELREQLVSEIALWVANVAIVLDPSRVVLGGGMIRSGHEICHRTQETVDRIAPCAVEVVAARFGAESALLGAGAVALSRD